MKRFFHHRRYLVHVVDTGRKVACSTLKRCEHVVRTEAANLDDGGVIEVWYDDWASEAAELWNTYEVRRGRAVMARQAS